LQHNRPKADLPIALVNVCFRERSGPKSVGQFQKYAMGFNGTAQ